MSERLPQIALLLLLVPIVASAACLPVPAGHADKGLYIDLRRGVGERESDGLSNRAIQALIACIDSWPRGMRPRSASSPPIAV